MTVFIHHLLHVRSVKASSTVLSCKQTRTPRARADGVSLADLPGQTSYRMFPIFLWGIWPKAFRLLIFFLNGPWTYVTHKPSNEKLFNVAIFFMYLLVLLAQFIFILCKTTCHNSFMTDRRTIIKKRGGLLQVKNLHILGCLIIDSKNDCHSSIFSAL